MDADLDLDADVDVDLDANADPDADAENNKNGAKLELTYFFSLMRPRSSVKGCVCPSVGLSVHLFI